MNPTYPLLLLVALLSLAPRLEAADYRIYSEQQRQEKIELLTGPASVGRQSRFEQVIEQMNMLSDKAAFLDVIDIGGAVFRKASAEHDDRLQMYMATYIGYACMFTGRLDSMRLYLDTALQMGLAAKDRFTVARVYNAEGIFRLTVEQDYVESLRYFHRALDEARVGSRDYLYPQILGNLAMTYYYRNDPAGIKYALDAYRIGKQRDDPYILFVGALSSAYMFYITGDYRGALRYIREAVPYANRNSAATAVHTLYGDILLELDHRDLALEHYTRAFSHTGNAQFGETAFL
jgi:tetratricopeptide (TPR) repeat protein